MSLSELWLAIRVGAWLSSLPIVLRLRTFPSLLERLAPAVERPNPGSALEPVRTAHIVSRVCGLPLFDLPLFPRACLRRSLALYYVFTRRGFPIELRIGVRKDGTDFHAHSWVTLDGKPFREKNPEKDFRTIYSYPAIYDRSYFPQIGQPQPSQG